MGTDAGARRGVEKEGLWSILRILGFQCEKYEAMKEFLAEKCQRSTLLREEARGIDIRQKLV